MNKVLSPTLVAAIVYAAVSCAPASPGSESLNLLIISLSNQEPIPRL
ncbi:MAG: hypothetical protein QOK23_1377 [Gammaproteobacteria bacterium]|jgi:hypothetical protein|nr:hypothetical protein [Gammaproteobacteria bacterium]